MKGNRSRKEQEAYERLMKQQAELKEKQAAQKPEGLQKYVAAGNATGNKSAYEAAQNSTGSRRQGWIQDRNGKIMPQPQKTKAGDTGAGSGRNRTKGTPASPGKRDYTGTWVNTAGPGGGTEIWKQVALNPGETAADYYEKKRRKHEEEQKEIDAAFRRAMEETQKELREQRLGVAEGFGRKKRYNRNYADLFGLPEGGDFRSRVEGTRGWDRLNGSEQYDRMVYIEKELERREKEREKGAEIGYNGGKEKEAALKELFQAWDRRYAAERSGVQRPKDLVDRKPWSRPDVRNGVLPGQTGNEFTQEWIEKGAEKYDTAGALFEVGKRFGEGGSLERIRADLTSHPEAALPNGLNAERLRMFQTAEKRDGATRVKADETEKEIPLFFPGGREEMLEYLREHPDATLPNGMNGRAVAEMDKIMQSKEEQELNQAEVWETISTETGSESSFDLATGLGSLNLEGTDALGTTAVMGKGGAIMEVVLNFFGFFATSYDMDDFKREIQVKNKGTENEEHRTVTQVGSLSNRREKAKYEPGVEYSLSEQGYNSNIGQNVGTETGQVIAINLLKEFVGEEPKPGKTYDVKVIFSEDYLNDLYMGSYIEDDNSNTTFVPHTQGIQIVLTENGGFSKSRRIDITNNFLQNTGE